MINSAAIQEKVIISRQNAASSLFSQAVVEAPAPVVEQHLEEDAAEGERDRADQQRNGDRATPPTGNTG